MKANEVMAWTMMAIGVIGFLVSFPLWLTGRIDDRAMLGVTLVLSWAALWYAAFIAIIDTRKERTDGK